MIERGRGWVLNIGSGSGQPASPARPGQGLYGGTKAMLIAATRCLATETAGSGVAVNVLMPQGASLTEMMDSWVQAGQLNPELTEPLEAMAEAALALCTADPTEHHGEVWKSLDLLVALNRPARELDGGEIAQGGTPQEMAENITTIAVGVSKPNDLREVEFHT
jgi:NAD(P)-dependent dehydrogenase (short-subunit alcohol dehydrogenase family)